MIDTHCHLTYAGLVERLDQVLARARAAGVQSMVTVGTDLDDAGRAADLAQRCEGVYSTIGIHPHHSDRWTDRALVADAFAELVRRDRVVALGEMGLDWHYPDPPRQNQRRVFAWQIQIARELTDAGAFAGPLIVHNREATADTLAMLRDSGLPPQRIVFHCFTGTPAELEAILAFGAMVGFTGIVTFRNAGALAQAAAAAPLDRVLIETDSPYLTPEPHRKTKINEPCFAVDVARFLARQRGLEEGAFIAAVDANARRVFGLG